MIYKKLLKEVFMFLKSKGSANTILVVLLVIAAFLIGSLWTRIQYMEKGKDTTVAAGNNNAGQAANVTNTPQPAAQPTVSFASIPPVSNKDHVRGSKNANLVLIEYSDFECPFCKRFDPVMKQVLEQYGNKVTWVYRHYPLPFHANAFMESEASECVAKYAGEEAFWTYADALYEKTTSTGTSFTKEQLVTMAGDQGVDTNKIQTCLDNNEMKATVQNQMDAGQKAGISGTPGTFIMNLKTKQAELVPGAYPFEEMKKTIDKLI